MEPSGAVIWEGGIAVDRRSGGVVLSRARHGIAIFVHKVIPLIKTARIVQDSEKQRQYTVREDSVAGNRRPPAAA